MVSSADLQQMQVDLDCVHTEDELHLHEVRVVQDMHEADKVGSMQILYELDIS
ncbi:hypothetical protein Tco_1177451, partial [Tanacetum coccineum]